MQFPTFSETFVALHEYEPFPWQASLADRVANVGWVDINAPTACGKTAVIDVWLYDLARRANSGEHINHRRLVYIVDRRIVVDGTYRHAVEIACKITDATEGPLRIIAQSLCALAGEQVPVIVARMRGASWRDESWASNPAQAVMLISTVDQAGSRLLGRGYGCSRSLQVVSAGLLGNDTLWLVDEAHLRQPAIDTIRRVSDYHQAATATLANPPQLVELTATPRDPDRCVGISQDDLAHPVLQLRLMASKPTALKKVAVGKGSAVNRQAKFTEAAIKHALDFQKAGGLVIGVIVNRVASARAVFDGLVTKKQDAVLLTGRCRPHDRDELLAEYFPKIKAGREQQPDKPVFVVATQCIEVGADIDFDALVTEAAPIDALRQRFGRLNRFGMCSETSSVVLCRSDSLVGKWGDAVYGHALANTWKWLTADKRKEIDFGLTALELPTGEDLTNMLVAPTLARQLLLDDVENLAAINAPTDIDISLYLHGTRSSADAYIVWRDDVGAMDPDRLGEISATVAARPPRSLEQLPIPAWQITRWLQGKVTEVSDIEGVSIRGDDANEAATGLALVFDTEDPDQSALSDGSSIKPGDLVILPSEYGGCDRFGWNPNHTDPVVDIGDVAAWRATRRPRLHMRFSDLPAGKSQESPSDETIETLSRSKELAAALLEKPLKYRRYASGWLVSTSKLHTYPGDTDSVVEPVEVPEEGKEVTLNQHTAGVSHWAKVFADAVVPAISDSITLAAELHDIGKADPRWQYAVAGGEFRDECLAKSSQSPDQLTRFWAAWRLSGLPKGWRHETLSVQLAEQICDDQLALHLIATHHGWGHPWPGAVMDAEPPDVDARQVGQHYVPELSASSRTREMQVELIGRCADRYEAIQRQYGMWQRCLLETVMILADWRQSARERLGLVECEQSGDAENPVVARNA